MNQNLPIIVGSGPAGLAAAYELCNHNFPSITFDKDSQVGGLCKTTENKGFRYDIGPHRFFTKNKEIQNLWNDMLPDDFINRPRLTRIYYKNKFFYYPLRVMNVLKNLGVYDSMGIILSYLKKQLFPLKPESTFEDWVSNRFGSLLYSIFFKTYTEKIWGIPCNTLSSDWASQRIRNLSLGRALLNALGRQNRTNVASLIDEFHYPRLGSGQMYESMARRVKQQGGHISLGQEVVRLHHAQGVIRSVQTVGKNGSYVFPASHCFSSMPITDLVQRLRPVPPDVVMEAANSLRYRSIITVNLLVKQQSALRDNWIYLHNPEVKAARLQLYHNWSPEMVPDSNSSSVALEYFCFENDALWNLSDSGLIQLAWRDLEKLGFYEKDNFSDGFVVRYAKAYPMYENNYEKKLNIIKDWLSQFSNLHCIGRYGQFRYNNMDHSIMTGILAVRKMQGEDVDPWSVNADAEYIEEGQRK